MSQWKQLLGEMFEKTFDNQSYALRQESILTNYFETCLSREEVVQKLQMAFKRGYVGFHAMDERFPETLVDEHLKKLFDGTDYVESRWCSKHGRMVVVLNLHKLGLDDYYSFRNHDTKFVDWCYDPDHL